MNSPPDNEDETRICVLVHGTWGSKSDFAFEDSLFCRSIKNSLSGSTTFHRFTWSGSNSSVARKSARIALSEYIDVLARGSAIPIYIVAHSHGGNIALDALRVIETSKKVRGLVTLGTPFLVSVERGWVALLSKGIGEMALFVSIFGLSVAALISAIFSLNGAMPLWVSPLSLLLLLGLFLPMAALQVKKPGASMTKLISDAARNRAQIILNEQQEAPVTTSTFVLWSKADEALWWLRRVTTLVNLPFMILELGLWIIGVWAVLGFTLGAPAFVIAKFGPESASRAVGSPIFAVYLGGIAIALLGVFAVLFGKFVQRIFGTGPGHDFWRDILTKTVVQREPGFVSGPLELQQAPVQGLHGGLWHSRYMRSGPVADAIANKISAWERASECG